MTCAKCSGTGATAFRGTNVLCEPCAERLDWLTILDIVQGGGCVPAATASEAPSAMSATVLGDIPADPFA